MFYKEDVEEILNKKEENEILSIFYKGDKNFLIRNIDDWNTTVKKEKNKTIGLKDLILKDNYIKLDYVVLEKKQEKYEKIKEYSIFLTYDLIEEIQIIKYQMNN